MFTVGPKGRTDTDLHAALLGDDRQGTVDLLKVLPRQKPLPRRRPR